MIKNPSPTEMNRYLGETVHGVISQIGPEDAVTESGIFFNVSLVYQKQGFIEKHIINENHFISFMRIRTYIRKGMGYVPGKKVVFECASTGGYDCSLGKGCDHFRG